MIPFLKEAKEYLKFKYIKIVADAGYESEENYLFLEENGQTAFIKPSNYEISKRRNYKNDISRMENMDYDAEKDLYICKIGRELPLAYIRHSKSKTGYINKKNIYQCTSCENCPSRFSIAKATALFKHMAARRGLTQQFLIASAATSAEELGNAVHPGTRKKLKQHGLSAEGKYAVQMTQDDYKKYDYLIGMDQWNIKNMMAILGADPERKVYRLLDFTEYPRDIADPWYTRDFDTTYDDIFAGCRALMRTVTEGFI